jgi:hypothetical protein
MMMGSAILSPPIADAAEGGYTNYIPALYGDFGVALAPEPGFYLRSDIYYYTAEQDRSVRSGRLQLDVELDIGMYVLTGLYATNQEFLGGRYAFGAALPVVYADISTTLGRPWGSFEVQEDRTAIGDLGIIPASLFWNRGKWHFNLYEVIMAPTGSYDVDRDVNAGLNYWSFDTSLATTYFNEEKGRELSLVLGYIYNTENSDTDYQTGQELHLNYMLNQFFSETFAVGLHGFVYKQITGDSGDGAILGDFKGEAAGIGPALLWATRVKETDLVFTAKWLHEFHAENRLKGDHFAVSLTLAF